MTILAWQMGPILRDVIYDGPLLKLKVATYLVFWANANIGHLSKLFSVFIFSQHWAAMLGVMKTSVLMDVDWKKLSGVDVDRQGSSL